MTPTHDVATDVVVVLVLVEVLVDVDVLVTVEVEVDVDVTVVVIVVEVTVVDDPVKVEVVVLVEVDVDVVVVVVIGKQVPTEQAPAWFDAVVHETPSSTLPLEKQTLLKQTPFSMQVPTIQRTPAPCPMHDVTGALVVVTVVRVVVTVDVLVEVEVTVEVVVVVVVVASQKENCARQALLPGTVAHCFPCHTEDRTAGITNTGSFAQNNIVLPIEAILGIQTAVRTGLL